MQQREMKDECQRAKLDPGHYWHSHVTGVCLEPVNPLTGDELRNWRAQAGFSQARLAAVLGVDHMTISRWERGLREIPPYLYLALRGLLP